MAVPRLQFYVAIVATLLVLFLDAGGAMTEARTTTISLDNGNSKVELNNVNSNNDDFVFAGALPKPKPPTTTCGVFIRDSAMKSITFSETAVIPDGCSVEIHSVTMNQGGYVRFLGSFENATKISIKHVTIVVFHEFMFAIKYDPAPQNKNQVAAFEIFNSSVKHHAVHKLFAQTKRDSCGAGREGGDGVPSGSTGGGVIGAVCLVMPTRRVWSSSPPSGGGNDETSSSCHVESEFRIEKSNFTAAIDAVSGASVNSLQWSGIVVENMNASSVSNSSLWAPVDWCSSSTGGSNTTNTTTTLSTTLEVLDNNFNMTAKPNIWPMYSALSVNGTNISSIVLRGNSVKSWNANNAHIVVLRGGGSRSSTTGGGSASSSSSSSSGGERRISDLAFKELHVNENAYSCLNERLRDPDDVDTSASPVIALKCYAVVVSTSVSSSPSSSSSSSLLVASVNGASIVNITDNSFLSRSSDSQCVSVNHRYVFLALDKFLVLRNTIVESTEARPHNEYAATIRNLPSIQVGEIDVSDNTIMTFFVTVWGNESFSSSSSSSYRSFATVQTHEIKHVETLRVSNNTIVLRSRVQAIRSGVSLNGGSSSSSAKLYQRHAVIQVSGRVSHVTAALEFVSNRVNHSAMASWPLTTHGDVIVFEKENMITVGQNFNLLNISHNEIVVDDAPTFPHLPSSSSSVPPPPPCFSLLRIVAPRASIQRCVVAENTLTLLSNQSSGSLQLSAVSLDVAVPPKFRQSVTSSCSSASATEMLVSRNTLCAHNRRFDRLVVFSSAFNGSSSSGSAEPMPSSSICIGVVRLESNVVNVTADDDDDGTDHYVKHVGVAFLSVILKITDVFVTSNKVLFIASRTNAVSTSPATSGGGTDDDSTTTTLRVGLFHANGRSRRLKANSSSSSGSSTSTPDDQDDGAAGSLHVARNYLSYRRAGFGGRGSGGVPAAAVAVGGVLLQEGRCFRQNVNISANVFSVNSTHMFSVFVHTDPFQNSTAAAAAGASLIIRDNVAASIVVTRSVKFVSFQLGGAGSTVASYTTLMDLTNNTFSAAVTSSSPSRPSSSSSSSSSSFLYGHLVHFSKYVSFEFGGTVSITENHVSVPTGAQSGNWSGINAIFTYDDVSSYPDDDGQHFFFRVRGSFSVENNRFDGLQLIQLPRELLRSRSSEGHHSSYSNVSIAMNSFSYDDSSPGILSITNRQPVVGVNFVSFVAKSVVASNRYIIIRDNRFNNNKKKKKKNKKLLLWLLMTTTASTSRRITTTTISPSACTATI